jgi:hypothetical protein
MHPGNYTQTNEKVQGSIILVAGMFRTPRGGGQLGRISEISDRGKIRSRDIANPATPEADHVPTKYTMETISAVLDITSNIT